MKHNPVDTWTEQVRAARLDAIADRLCLATRTEMRALAADGVSPHIAAVLARSPEARKARLRTQGRRQAIRRAERARTTDAA